MRESINRVLDHSFDDSRVLTKAEILAGITVVNAAYAPGDVRRYGTNTTPGTTDMTAAIQAAVTQAGQVDGAHVFIPPQTYNVTAQITIGSNVTIEMVKGTILQGSTTNTSIFAASNQSNIHISGGALKNTVSGSVANVAGILFTTCTNCIVESTEFTAMQYDGVLLVACQYCTVKNTYHHNYDGTLQDQADIAILSSNTTAASFNIVDGNYCYGGGEHGILIQDPYSSKLSIRNVVSNNRIGAHFGYGIAVYMPDAGDSYTQLSGNLIEDISAYSGNNSSGNGIYVAGAGAGGTQITGNIIRNCCIGTANRSLAPGGIGINGITVSNVPVVITGNIIEGMTQYDGICVNSVAGHVTVTGNGIRWPGSNTTGQPIRIDGSSHVTVIGNNINILSTSVAQTGIFIYANTIDATDITVEGNIIIGGNAAGIQVAQTGGFNVRRISLSNNSISGGGGSHVPMLLGDIGGGSVTGNSLVANTPQALSISNCTNLRISNNFWSTLGSSVVGTSGTCTATYVDKTNTVGVFANAGTGAIFEQLGSAALASGTAAVGDRVEQSVPVVGSPKGWRCTVAGSPGTFVSEGNL